MPALARFDLTMDAEDKQLLSNAASLMGTTLAAFVRLAAKEKAHQLLEREQRVTLSQHDMLAFSQALRGSFVPNPALKSALQLAQDVRRA